MSNDNTNVNGEYEKTCKEAKLIYFYILPQNLPEGTKEDQGNSGIQ